MPTALLAIASVVRERLAAAPTYGVDTDSIRLSHRVALDRAHCPAIYVMPERIGDQERGKGCVRRPMYITVAVLTRSDDGIAAADTILQRVVARIAQDSAIGPAYPSGVVVHLVQAEVDEEAADADVTRIDISLRCDFDAGEESLDIA